MKYDTLKYTETSMTYPKYVYLEKLLENISVDIFVSDSDIHEIERFYEYLKRKIYEKYEKGNE